MGLLDFRRGIKTMKPVKTPRTVDIQITGRCNLRCKYCSYFTSSCDSGVELPAGEWTRFFEELNGYGVMNVVLQGGEPFSRGDLDEIIASIVRNRMRFKILSNGTLITDEIARLVASSRRCDSVQVSIDGADSYSHDVFRGTGTFAKAMEGLKRLMRNGVPATVRVTVHKHNYTDLEAIANLLLEDLGLRSFSTNSAGFMGLCRYNADAVCMSAEESSKAMETLLLLNRKYNGRISASSGPLANGMIWLGMEKARKEGRPIDNRGRLTACNVPFSAIAVRADGIIVPCNQLSHIELGRINKDSLLDIWNRHPELVKLRERRRIPLSSFQYCSGCEYMDYCTGNCPALSYTMMGEIDHPSPDGCLRAFIAGGGRLPEQSQWPEPKTC